MFAAVSISLSDEEFQQLDAQGQNYYLSPYQQNADQV